MGFFAEENQMWIPEVGVKMMLKYCSSRDPGECMWGQRKGCGNADKASGSQKS